MRVRFAAVFLSVSAVSLISATSAFAENGQGLYGETNDKVVTLVSLGLVAGFTLLVITASAIQAALDRRKEEKKAAQRRQLAGW